MRQQDDHSVRKVHDLMLDYLVPSITVSFVAFYILLMWLI
jgi:hypothetical protein